MSDADMFEWAEAQRALASGMSDEELARALLKDPMNCVGSAEGEFAVSEDDAKQYRFARAVIREAAYRLAKVRDYEEGAA
jgi:hypothetical protein